jgi:hypothetical protein
MTLQLAPDQFVAQSRPLNSTVSAALRRASAFALTLFRAAGASLLALPAAYGRALTSTHVDPFRPRRRDQNTGRY